MIVVTGAAGFIGSALLAGLQQQGYGNLVAVDDFSNQDKNLNLRGKNGVERVEREQFFEWATRHATEIQFIFHIGARTDTAEFDESVLNHLNVHYSQRMWQLCTAHSIPLIYASSAATYGNGEYGFSDNPDNLAKLQPLNPYGWSKHHFDLWALGQPTAPPFWAGFKFFNVFGPNEYHKHRMASVVLHACKQIQQTGRVKLFRSHRPGIADGMQQRDFIYVKDVLNVLLWFMENRKNSGLYNLGTGVARSFLDLTHAVFSALQLPPAIDFVDIPEDIRDKYQYYTCADMQRVQQTGYSAGFSTLENAVTDYVNGYLKEGKYF
ncbi:MAG: ADP-glyceromanno-heptose 6-epimerase [Bacteroidetes bacterium]|nr:ADP-glyceromanno-heptose 6-epimerase [Bacteroidota bacterium]